MSEFDSFGLQILLIKISPRNFNTSLFHFAKETRLEFDESFVMFVSFLKKIGRNINIQNIFFYVWTVHHQKEEQNFPWEIVADKVFCWFSIAEWKKDCKREKNNDSVWIENMYEGLNTDLEYEYARKKIVEGWRYRERDR